MSASKNPTLGIWLMVVATATFAAQDGFSRLLAGVCSTTMTIMLGYRVFAAFVVAAVAIVVTAGLYAASPERSLEHRTA